MAENYNRCEKCGVTYMDEGKGCPNCGAGKGGARTGSRLFYHFDKKEFRAVIIFAIIAIAFAIWNIYQVVDLKSDPEIAETRDVYEMCVKVVDSGLYDSVIGTYGEVGGYSSAEIYSAMAEMESYFGFMDAMCFWYVAVSVVLIIAAAMVLARLRFSFKVMIGAYILSTVVLTVMEFWALFAIDYDMSGTRVGIRVVVAVSVIKWLWRYDMMAREDVTAPTAVAVSPAAGVPMPTVKELNSDFDSFMAQQPTPVSTEEKPAEMASVAPVGMAEPTERDRMFTPTATAPSVQPVMPLAERTAEVGSAADAVTALENPMIPVEMMEDETMPDAAPSAEISAPAAQPVQQPSAKGIWFCSGCGSLNENGSFCVSCGRKRD